MEEKCSFLQQFLQRTFHLHLIQVGNTNNLKNGLLSKLFVAPFQNTDENALRQ